MGQTNKDTFKGLGCSLLSACLLALCFPKFDLGFLGWICLIPFLYAISKVHHLGKALLLSFICGFVFFVISLQWLKFVTYFGWIFMAVLEALFFTLFGYFVFESRKLRSETLKIFWTALAWTVVEWMRSEVPIFGLGWNLLAYSQSHYPIILQSANAVGAYGVGFVMALVNGCLFSLVENIRKHGKDHRWHLIFQGLLPKTYAQPILVSLITIFVVFTVLVSHGIFYLHRNSRLIKTEKPIKVSVVQGNIPQSVKWEPMAREKIVDIYLKLTEISSYEKPDLILWPEAAFPGYFNQDNLSQPISALANKLKTPILVGSPHLEGEQAFNSAYLLNPYGEITARYDKQYLVPFGEYVPLKLIFGWLEPLAYSLGVSDFFEGKESKVFQWAKSDFSFSVLICFEDTFPQIARTMVDRGAKFLAVITNDAWFEDSAAAYQHLQASVFRAVENGIYIARAANTGISAFISPVGEVVARVQERDGADLGVLGTKASMIYPPSGITLYRIAGYLFPYFACLIFLTLFVAEQFERKKKYHDV